MTAKKKRGKKKEVTGAATIPLTEPGGFLVENLAFRRITEEGRCSCGGCLWLVVAKGEKIKKCGDCGYIF